MPSPVLLLVDDIPELGLIVQRLGRCCGYTVVHCLRAEEAWDYLQEARPDLLLLDINLPGMSGLELRRLVRTTARLADLPVVLLSSAVQLDELDGAIEGKW